MRPYGVPASIDRGTGGGEGGNFPWMDIKYPSVLLSAPWRKIHGWGGKSIGGWDRYMYRRDGRL